MAEGLGECTRCGEKFLTGDKKEEKAVKTDLGVFHIQSCFNCDECNQTLENKSYTKHDGKYLDAECYKNLYSPVCAGCFQAIDGKFTTALDQDWHMEHFVCDYCGKDFSKTENKYTEEDDKPFHAICLSQKNNITCITCEEPIVGLRYMIGDMYFHRDHYNCSFDNHPIDPASPVRTHERKLYCMEHYPKEYEFKCRRCHEGIGSVWAQVAHLRYHLEHFTCARCGIKLTGSPFRYLLDDLVCVNDWEKASDKEKADSLIMMQDKGIQPSETDYNNVIIGGVFDKAFASGDDTAPEGELSPMEKEMSGMYSMEMLKDMAQFNGTPYRSKLEWFLSDEEFVEVFKINKLEYKGLRLWRQQRRKKAVGLF